MDEPRRATDYDSSSTTRMLGVAADVLRSFGSGLGGSHLAIVGGLVPSLLIPTPPVGAIAHVGTADLDLHVSLQLLDGETGDYYASIIGGLRGLELRQDDQGERPRLWRWLGKYRDMSLRVELLCPARSRGGRPEPPIVSTPAETNIGPHGEIAALAIGRGHLVVGDTEIVTRRVETRSGWLDYPFPVAGISSWLCLKSDAITRRDKPKDAYDVVWVVDAMGPGAAAARVAESSILGGVNRDEVVGLLSGLVGDQFRDVGSAGPIAYAEFFESGRDPSLIRHALGAIAEFATELRTKGVIA